MKLETLPDLQPDFTNERTFGDKDHLAKIIRWDEDYMVFCSCGSRWAHPKSVSIAKVNETYEAHVAYFNKPASPVL